MKSKSRYRCYRLRKQVAKLYKVVTKEKTVYVPASDMLNIAESKHLLSLIADFNYQVQLTL